LTLATHETECEYGLDRREVEAKLTGLRHPVREQRLRSRVASTRIG
jgi:hypothetical protein